MEYLPDLNGPTPLHKLLMSEKFKLIQNILEELQEHDMEKWGNVQVFELYPDIPTIFKESKVICLMNTLLIRKMKHASYVYTRVMIHPIYLIHMDLSFTSCIHLTSLLQVLFLPTQ